MCLLKKIMLHSRYLEKIQVRVEKQDNEKLARKEKHEKEPGQSETRPWTSVPSKKNCPGTNDIQLFHWSSKVYTLLLFLLLLYLYLTYSSNKSAGKA